MVSVVIGLPHICHEMKPSIFFVVSGTILKYFWLNGLPINLVTGIRKVITKEDKLAPVCRHIHQGRDQTDQVSGWVFLV